MKTMGRRGFMATGAAAVAAVAGDATAQDDSAKSVRVGVVGTGGRGTSLLGNILRMPEVQVPALCDIAPANLARAQALVKKSGRPEPVGYGDGDRAYEQLMARDDLDAVLIATPWNWHTPMAVCAMRNGKYAGVEVPAALSLEECWELVNTSEQTGVPCMMMENWSFRRDNLAVLNMIRQGLLGDIVHCHCAHSHDCVDHWFFDGEGNMRWGGEFLVKYNRDQYPTHSVGPVLSWMDINCGDRFESITSTASASLGINAHFARKFGPDHPNAKRTYAQGDIVTSVIKTAKGKTLIVNYDMQLPRPYDNRWLIQGTLGLYNEQREAVYLTGRSPKYHEWEPFAPYQEEYDHPWWKNMRKPDGSLGHGGTDWLELSLFIDAVRTGSPTPIDVYDSVTMSCIVALSGMSIEQGSAPVACPDFTRGAWESRKPSFGVA
ncbi:MAG: Gfo/Idh/MocA family oxidoreductase [bacterium]|nr:Gfo/Idh/MocA family oxidoreductase [bacterium]